MFELSLFGGLNQFSFLIHIPHCPCCYFILGQWLVEKSVLMFKPTGSRSELLTSHWKRAFSHGIHVCAIILWCPQSIQFSDTDPSLSMLLLHSWPMIGWRKCADVQTKWFSIWIIDFTLKKSVQSWYTTACLKAQKWFLGVGGANFVFFVLKQILLGHNYPMTMDFTWTNCEPH